MDKSLIGPEVINSWTFYVCRIYPSIPYRLLKYVLVNCPHLQFLDMDCLIHITWFAYLPHKRCNSGYKLTWLIHWALLKNIWNLFDLNVFLLLKHTWTYYQPTCLMLNVLFVQMNGTTQSTMTLDNAPVLHLTFQKLKSFRMNIECVGEFRRGTKAIDSSFFITSTPMTVKRHFTVSRKKGIALTNWQLPLVNIFRIVLKTASCLPNFWHLNAVISLKNSLFLTAVGMLVNYALVKFKLLLMILISLFLLGNALNNEATIQIGTGCHVN